VPVPAVEGEPTQKDATDALLLAGREPALASELLEQVRDMRAELALGLQLLDQRLRVDGLAVFVALEREGELGGGHADVPKEIPVAAVHGLKVGVGSIGVEAVEGGVAPLVVEGFSSVVLCQPRLPPSEGLLAIECAAVSVGGEALFFLATALWKAFL
jgi:hypothetical protein